MDSNIPGSRIKNLRLQNNITPMKLAKYLNISNTTLSQYELGTRRPDYEILKNIAEYFNVSTDYLLGITDSMEKEPPAKRSGEFCYTFDLSGLPEQVIEQISEYIEFIKQKYNKQEKQDKPEKDG